MSEKNVAERIKEVFDKGVKTVDSIMTENTNDEQEKKIADAVIDVIEEISDIMPYLLDKAIDFTTGRIRKRYNIPDNDVTT
jgi:hypothetical protein